jgi:hypothetical protein
MFQYLFCNILINNTLTDKIKKDKKVFIYTFPFVNLPQNDVLTLM